jgi:Protein of unknown function (DUF4242)
VRFLVESYAPSGDVEIEEIDRRARTAAEELAGEGAAVRHLGSILVPEDEMCVLHYEASSRELALQAAERAGITSDRVVEALEIPAPQ